MKIDEELVAIDLEVNSKEEVLSILGNQLQEKGFVKEGFIESVLKREQSYPTGLPTEPFGVAIPHTDGDMVHVSKIAFASLKNPVKFFAMGSSDVTIEVKVVFMLALKNPADQLEMLQKLVGLFQEPEMVAKLARTKDINDLNKLFKAEE
ncbi:PTS system galactitol-specific IIA component [Planomicrobium koreense]|uniref:PTS system galactitol-specific IIA component n=1 Tax=Planococcus koreensis TaxID=112331 RepID=A0A7W8CVT0_9BACL|nr:PTS sugar transporter subunit IIA [Planococcus koreensis]MBB5180935.1 PTS system galactitol-specific IIA component [Planococcus koreensis]